MRYLLLLIIGLYHSAHAQSYIESGQCQIINNTWYLSATTHITLEQDPIDALKSGIPLYFRYDIKIYPDHSWFSEAKKISHTRHLRYNHITLSYQVEDPITLKEHTFSNIEKALEKIGNIKNLPLLDSALLEDSTEPKIAVRLTLEEDKLPFSLRLTALVSKAWNNINSEWWICPQKTEN